MLYRSEWRKNIKKKTDLSDCSSSSEWMAFVGVNAILPDEGLQSETSVFLTLSVLVVLLNSPNLCLYFSLNKFERILLLIFSSLLCLINSHFLITKCLIFYVLCKEKLGVDNWLGLKGLIIPSHFLIVSFYLSFNVILCGASSCFYMVFGHCLLSTAIFQELFLFRHAGYNSRTLLATWC